jgi:3-oxoacyl-[acyl-carrier protein] reductase
MTFFENKTCLITGAGRGIGAATAQLLAQHGARVICVSRTESQLKTIVDEINSTSPKYSADYIQCDVSNANDVSNVYTKLHEKGHKVDVLVNAAGVIFVEPVESITEAQWDTTFNVNAKGSFLMAQHAFKDMAELGGGSIVNISSLAGIRGLEKFPGFCAYTASKHAVVGLTESLAAEGKAHNIRVNCIAPGAVDTQMLQEAAPGLKTDAKPADIAKSILFLADTSQAPHISGTIMEIFSNGDTN